MRRLLNTPVILGVILLLPLLALGCSSSSDDEGGGAAASGALDGRTRAVEQAQELEDCGPDEECLRTAIGNCDSAKGKLQSVSEGYGLEFYVESRGVDGEDCVYYYKVVTAIGPTEPPEGLRQQVGKDMVCAIPQAIIVKPEGLIVYPIEPPQRVLLELCEGPLIDAAKDLLGKRRLDVRHLSVEVAVDASVEDLRARRDRLESELAAPEQKALGSGIKGTGAF